MSVNSRLKTTYVKGNYSVGREFQSVAVQGKKARKQGKDQQFCISAFVTYPTISSSNQSMESHGSLKQQHDRISQRKESHCRSKILTSEEKNPERAGLRESQLGI